MKERLKQFADQCRGDPDFAFEPRFDKEKFAELIVKECWALVDYDNKKYIKAQFPELFGVE